MTGRNLSYRLAVLAVFALVLFAMTGCGGGNGEPTNGTPANGTPANGEQRGQVTLAYSAWNDAIIPSHVVRWALEEQGYTVRTRDILDMAPMFLALSQRDVDIYAGYWLPTFHGSYTEEHPGRFVSVGNLYNEGTPVGWVIPDYVAEEHNIRSIPDLEGNHDLFRGRIYGYEAGSGGTLQSLEALEAYGLSEYQFVPGSVPAMLTELQTSIRLNEPVASMGWRPHWMFARLPLTMLEDPLDMFGAAEEYVSHAVNTEFHDEFPEVVRFLENFTIPLLEIEDMLYLVEEEGADVEATARDWYEQNRDTIGTWWN